MKDNTKCFVLVAGGYEETTYAEIKKCRETDPMYNENHYFIQSGGMLMEVSQADHIEFEKVKDRQKYIARESKRVDEVSLDALDTEDFSGRDIVVDPSPPPDTLVVDKLMIETVLQCMDRLNADERMLIDAVFKDGQSERELAAKLDISQPAVHKRIKKVLAKIKEFLEI